MSTAPSTAGPQRRRGLGSLPSPEAFGKVQGPGTMPTGRSGQQRPSPRPIVAKIPLTTIRAEGVGVSQCHRFSFPCNRSFLLRGGHHLRAGSGAEQGLERGCRLHACPCPSPAPWVSFGHPVCLCPCRRRLLLFVPLAARLSHWKAPKRLQPCQSTAQGLLWELRGASRHRGLGP